MFHYALRRLMVALPTLFIIITIAFFMIRVAPGGPFDLERSLPAEIEKNILAAYDLDQPLWRQYGKYLWKIVTEFDFGPSYKYVDFSVNELIESGYKASLQLGLSAIVLAVILGVAAGSLAALHQNSRLDYTIMAFSMTGIAVPNFVMAPLLSLLLGVYLKEFAGFGLPVAGWGDGAIANKILPITALALPQIAYIARLTRGSMIETLNQNYVRTARAKGLRERIVIVRHTIRGALLPVVSYLGPATAAITTGSVVIETIFDFPGIGRHFVQGALNRDYTVVMGVMILYAALIIVLNLLVDVVYGLLDPKVKLS